MNSDEINDDSLAVKVMDVINRQAKQKKDADYRKWCDDFASLPDNSGRALKDGLIAGVELQPSRWIQHGLDLIGSRRASGTVQLTGGIAGPDLRSFLPYPVFQMGAEIFLKGMWLYQHEECRSVHEKTYVAPQRREYFGKELKGISRTHDLLEIIGHVKSIAVYSQNERLSLFLKIVAGISKKFYQPVTQSKSPWADERYPKRFYGDSSKVGHADAHRTYPEHWPIARLFAEAADQIEFVWRDEKID
jgi:hypothetical protein